MNDGDRIDFQVILLARLTSLFGPFSRLRRTGALQSVYAVRIIELYSRVQYSVLRTEMPDLYLTICVHWY
jgi:hypothetical protein